MSDVAALRTAQEERVSSVQARIQEVRSRLQSLSSGVEVPLEGPSSHAAAAAAYRVPTVSSTPHHNTPSYSAAPSQHAPIQPLVVTMSPRNDVLAEATAKQQQRIQDQSLQIAFLQEQISQIRSEIPHVTPGKGKLPSASYSPPSQGGQMYFPPVPISAAPNVAAAPPPSSSVAVARYDPNAPSQQFHEQYQQQQPLQPRVQQSESQATAYTTPASLHRDVHIQLSPGVSRATFDHRQQRHQNVVQADRADNVDPSLATFTEMQAMLRARLQQMAATTHSADSVPSQSFAALPSTAVRGSGPASGASPAMAHRNRPVDAAAPRALRFVEPLPATEDDEEGGDEDDVRSEEPRTNQSTTRKTSSQVRLNAPPAAGDAVTTTTDETNRERTPQTPTMQRSSTQRRRGAAQDTSATTTASAAARPASSATEVRQSATSGEPDPRAPNLPVADSLPWDGKHAAATPSVLTALSGAEVFAILRLRGVVVSNGVTGEHLLPAEPCHTMYLTPGEHVQLVQLRELLASASRHHADHHDRSLTSLPAGNSTTTSSSRPGSRSPSASGRAAAGATSTFAHAAPTASAEAAFDKHRRRLIAFRENREQQLRHRSPSGTPKVATS